MTHDLERIAREVEMSNRNPGPLWIVFAVACATFAAAMARADDGAFVLPTADVLVAQWGVSALIVGLVVRALRQFLARWLAPHPATPRSRSLTLVACLAVGVVLGVIGTAPPVAFGLAGKLVGGVTAGAFAYFVAKAAGPRWRGEKRKAPEVSP